MATESIIPVQLELTSGTYYTLWAPSWKENGEEWQAFLGSDDSLYFFTSPAELLAYINSGAPIDLAEHPKWRAFLHKDAESQAVPTPRHVYDLVAVPAMLAEKPSYASVDKVERNLAMARSLGRVCGIDRISGFFNSYSLLSNLSRGAEHFTGDDGNGEWSAIGQTILSNWGPVLDALDNEAVDDGGFDDNAGDGFSATTGASVDAVNVSSTSTSVPVDAPTGDTTSNAGAIGTHTAPVFVTPAIPGNNPTDSINNAQRSIDDAIAAREDHEKEVAAERASQAENEEASPTPATDPYDSTIWASVGIDPITIVMNGRTLYTLRCYINDRPVFLGKFGQIYTFTSGRALSRWIVDHKDHDLATVSTWGELVDKANVGELKVETHPTNNYVFTNLAESIAKGPNAVDTDQLGQAYEVIADASDWAEDDAVNSVFLAVPELQGYISYMLGTSSNYLPSAPYDTEADGWRRLEEMLSERFSKS